MDPDLTPEQLAAIRSRTARGLDGVQGRWRSRLAHPLPVPTRSMALSYSRSFTDRWRARRRQLNDAQESLQGAAIAAQRRPRNFANSIQAGVTGRGGHHPDAVSAGVSGQLRVSSPCWTNSPRHHRHFKVDSMISNLNSVFRSFLANRPRAAQRGRRGVAGLLRQRVNSASDAREIDRILQLRTRRGA